MSLDITPIGGGGGGATVTPPYLTSGSSLYGPLSAITDPSLPAWAWVNQGTAALVTTNGEQTIQIAASAGAVDIKLRVIPLPSIPFTATAMLSGMFTPANFTRAGLFLYETGSNKSYTINCSTGTTISIDTFNNLTTYASTPATQTWSGLQRPSWWRIAHDGTNISYSFSTDGITYLVLHTTAKTTHWTSAPTHIGFGGASVGSSALSINLLSWKVT